MATKAQLMEQLAAAQAHITLLEKRLAEATKPVPTNKVMASRKQLMASAKAQALATGRCVRV